MGASGNNPTDLPTATLTAADPEVAGAADALVARELFDSLNGVRASKGLSALSWSDDLESEVQRLAEKEVGENCSHSNVRHALAPHAADTIYRWTGVVRRFAGDPVRQNISARYVVSDWAMGAEDYDAIAGKCWKSGPCTSFAPIVRPESTQAGCAYKVCGSQEQIWICRFGS